MPLQRDKIGATNEGSIGRSLADLDAHDLWLHVPRLLLAYNSHVFDTTRQRSLVQLFQGRELQEGRCDDELAAFSIAYPSFFAVLIQSLSGHVVTDQWREEE